MGDDFPKGESDDCERVNIREAWERRHWARVFGVSDVDFRKAVVRVGPQIAALRMHFSVPARWNGR